jgi:hypothetical protein
MVSRHALVERAPLVKLKSSGQSQSIIEEHSTYSCSYFDSKRINIVYQDDFENSTFSVIGFSRERDA